MQLDKQAVRELVRRAFASVPIPTRIEDMRLPRFVGDDSYLLAKALFGKHWSEISLKDLFHHRESLGALSGEVYRAYVPAYLLAAIELEDPLRDYGPDIRFYTLTTLIQWPHQTARGADTRERLSGLDADQRAAIAAVLRYLAAQGYNEEAAKVLETWSVET